MTTAVLKDRLEALFRPLEVKAVCDLHECALRSDFPQEWPGHSYLEDHVEPKTEALGLMVPRGTTRADVLKKSDVTPTPVL